MQKRFMTWKKPWRKKLLMPRLNATFKNNTNGPISLLAKVPGLDFISTIAVGQTYSTSGTTATNTNNTFHDLNGTVTLTVGPTLTIPTGAGYQLEYGHTNNYSFDGNVADSTSIGTFLTVQ